MTLKELAQYVIEKTKIPMSAQEIWDYAIENKLNEKYNWKGKTPWLTIAAKVKQEINSGERTSFIILSNERPVKFFLKEIEQSKNKKLIKKNKRLNLSEKDIHKYLTYYVHTYHSIYTKTIHHEKSCRKSKGMNEWLHPDIIGMYSPHKEWEKTTVDLNTSLGGNRVKLYSYELKLNLDFSNIRQAFFQAVSNSSWANEGYLVSSNILDDIEFLDELKRLNSAFGIGIIELDINSPDDSKIVCPATFKENLDWDTINKLIQTNREIEEIFKDITAFITTNRFYNTIFDPVLELNK